LDRYSFDVLEEIRRLRTEVDELKALLGQRGGLTTASAGWKIGNMATPATPAGGGHLFASGGNPFWKSSGGIVYDLRQPSFPLASGVSDPPDFTSAATAPATYTATTQNMLTNLRADAAGTKVALDNLLSSLRNGDVIGG
jgi:hypothetical protein